MIAPTGRMTKATPNVANVLAIAKHRVTGREECAADCDREEAVDGEVEQLEEIADRAGQYGAATRQGEFGRSDGKNH